MEYTTDILLTISPIFASIVGLTLTYLVGRIIYHRVTNPLSSLPGPQISKWTGCVLTYHWFFAHRTEYIHKLHQEYGPIVRISPEEVSFHDLSAAREIHKVGSQYVKSPWYQDLVLGNTSSLFATSNILLHSRLRRLLSGAIADSSLKQFFPAIMDHIALYISRIEEEMKDRGAADIFKWSTFLATDIIGELSFGESFRMLEQGKVNQYVVDLQSIAKFQPLRTIFPSFIHLGKYVKLPGFKDAIDLNNRLKRYAVQSIDRYKEMLENRTFDPKPTLFTKMFNAGENGLTEEEIRNNAVTYIAAGSDTTALTLTYLLFTVCQNKDISKKLVAEIQGLPDNFTDNDCRDAPYLNQVITETLRLYSPVPASLPRVTPPGGAKLAGYEIPQGIIVSTQAYTYHRDPNIFHDPERFDPSRWESPTKEMKVAMMPFGGGSRMCIGIHLAWIELRLATSHFFRRFPNARVSSKEGMSEKDMIPEMYFLTTLKGHRCLLEV